MVLLHAAALLVIGIVSVIFLGRFFAKITEVLARYFVCLDITIDSFGLFSIRGIQIRLSGGRTLVIENISLQTKWTHSNIKRAFTILFGKTEFIQDVQVASQMEEKSIQKKKASSRRRISSNNERISKIVSVLCQFLAISFCHVDLVLRLSKEKQIKCELNKGLDMIVKPNGICLDCVVSAKTIETQLTTVNSNGVFDSVAKLTVEMLVETSFQPFQGINSTDVQVSLHSIQAVVNEGVFQRNIDIPLHDKSLEPPLNKGTSPMTEEQTTEEQLTSDLWFQLAKVPKQIQVDVNKTCISFINNNLRKINLEISQIITIFEQKVTIDSLGNQCDWNLALSGVTVSGIDSCELFKLSRLRYTSKLYESNNITHLGSSVSIESIHNNYIHNECVYWMEYFKSRLRERKTAKSRASRGMEFRLPIKVDVEVLDCSTCLCYERADQPLCRAVLASCILNVDFPGRGLDPGVASSEIRLETRLENAYLYFDGLKTLPGALDYKDNIFYALPDYPAILPNTSRHIWGRAVAIGSFSMQCCVERMSDNQFNIKMKSQASCLVVEWSHQVCTSILYIINQFSFGTIPTSKDNYEETPNRRKICMDSEFTLRGVNVFYVGNRTNGVDSFMCRTDLILVAIPVSGPVLLEAFGLMISRMVGIEKAPYKCVLSGDICNPCLSIPVIKLSFTNSKVIMCSIQDTVVQWDATLHLALNERIHEIAEDFTSLNGIFVQRKKSKEKEEADDNTKEVHQSVMSGMQIKLVLSAFKLDMKTSPSTSFGVQLTNSTTTLQANDINVVIKTAILLFDDRNIFSFKDIKLQKSSQVNELMNARKEFVNLTTNNNTTWVIGAQETHIFFPYQFDFASSKSELVNIAKMLKDLHRKPADSSCIGPLPPDLWLHFNKIVFEIEDDPFEVKLGVNYALLLDEAKHWIDRAETLQNRLNTIRMSPGNLLTVQKEIMLHKKLLEKNAELYIQRSKAFYNEFPMRTSLLMWELKGLDLMVLADESYHGKPKAVEKMMKLNRESPFPASDMDFTTLWCRTVRGRLSHHCVKLRDYSQSLFTSRDVKLTGTFLAAEQAAREIAKYNSTIAIEKPWEDLIVQRSLTVLKYYYDLDLDVNTLEYAWGVDTEPGLAMVSLAFEWLSKPSKDPSKPLPFYDKIRLLLHGRFHMVINKWLLFFSAARNPYETTERMEVDWSNVDVLWTNRHIEVVGDFDLQTRTASRYDDRQVLHLPAFKICADMTWNCTGNANDHFSVMPFAPTKLPELAPNQAHDTYAAFRSQSLSLHVALETAIDKIRYKNKGPPHVCLYASTFRWFKKYQEVVLRYTSRPIKHGKYFDRTRGKKKALGRHYKEVSLSFKFPEMSVWYWGSFSQQRGFELKCGLGSLETQYRLALRPFSGNLTRRPAADWTATKLKVQIKQITCHLYGVEQVDGQVEGQETEDVSSIDLEPTKYYFLTTESLEYYRQDCNKSTGQNGDEEQDSQNYNHQLVCHGSKGVWTLTNRRIIFGLFEAYTNAEVLKKNLSADALKITIVEKKQKSMPVSPDVSSMKPRSMSLLQKLVSEKDSKFTVFTEEGTGSIEPAETVLQGVTLCSTDDVISHTWHIKLVNSQIVLQGTDTKGGVLVTTGNTTVLNRLHRPVWSEKELLNKKTWVGKLENLQYFATVSPEDSINLNNIPWLDVAVITGRQTQSGFDIANIANIVGSGEAVGGVVTSVVGAATTGQDVPQLQRIVARCGCEFYFVNFSTELDPLAKNITPNMVPQSPASSNHLGVNRLPTVDTYTIRHKLLEISTNSSQYLMLIDIVNNVVLYTEPKKKETIERLQKMTFRVQLSAKEDQRGQILKQQNIVRSHQAEMKSLQRDLYELNLMRKQAMDDQELTKALVELERTISNKKELLNSASTELRLLISVYKDVQINLNIPTPEKAPSSRADPTKLAEVHFNHVSWQLNQADGQLEIADVTFRDFSYSKTTLSDATIEHRFEVPKFNVRNLLPNSIYKHVLMQNSLSGQSQNDRSVMFRLYCRVKPPVAGIGIKEHLEVNVCPLSVGLTYGLFSKVMVFFFPQRAHEYESDVTGGVDLFYKGGTDHDEKDLGDDDLFRTDDFEDGQLKTTSLKRCPSTASSLSSSSDTSLDSSKSKKNLLTTHTDSSPSSPGPKDKGKKKSTFYRPLDEHDDLEKMKERASKNHSFIYVKVTEVLFCVSYKGEKEKNIVDVHDFNLTLPTLEYHNRTWTWHDLLIAMKKDCINVLVSQIIKEKLHLKGAHGMEGKDTKSQPREEDKAKLLFGDRSKVGKKKSNKSLLGKFVKKTLNPKHSGLLQPDGAGPEPVNLEGEEHQEESDEEQETEEPPQETR